LRIREIHLDLDDVLCAFTPYVYNCLVGTTNEISYDWWLSEWGFGMAAAVDEGRELLGKDALLGDFWSHVTRSMWATVPKTPLCDWLVEASCRAVGSENVFILSRPTPFGDCHGGKADWVRGQLGSAWVDRMILTKYKAKLAKSGRLLVDDSDDNIDAFRAGGGSVITCPRPWNCFRGEDPVEYIRHKWTWYFADPMPELFANKEEESATVETAK
jgi:hypothetical protein